MAKRFTDTCKWQPWFRKLPVKYKCLWIYLCDLCDYAGVWERDDEMATFNIDPTINLDEALNIFNQEKARIKVLAKGKKWHITDFIPFQYGRLSKSVKPHMPVYRDLSKHGIDSRIYESEFMQGYSEAIHSLKDKDKEQDKEKEKDKDLKGIVKGDDSDRKRPFGEDGLVLMTQAEHEKLLVKFGELKTAEFIEKLANYIGSKGKKYKSHYHTILSWAPNEKPQENGQYLTKAQKHNLEGLRRLNEKLENRDIQQSSVIDLNLLPGA